MLEAEPMVVMLLIGISLKGEILMVDSTSRKKRHLKGTGFIYYVEGKLDISGTT